MKRKKERKNKNPPKASKEKRDKRSPNFTRKAQKCNKRLMYKTNRIQPDPRVERNKDTSKHSQGSSYSM